MKINRNVCGSNVEIELTNEEILAAYKEKYEMFLLDDILEKYTALYGDVPKGENLKAMIKEYREWRADLWVGEDGQCGAAHEFVTGLAQKYPPKKDKYIVRISRPVWFDFVVEARDEQSAMEAAYDAAEDQPAGLWNTACGDMEVADLKKEDTGYGK